MVSTRRRDYDISDGVEDPGYLATADIPTNEETLLVRRRRWSALLHAQDYRTVITEVLEQELPKYGTSNVIIPSSLSSIMGECVLILASAPLIFTAAVDGILAHQYPLNTNLQEEYTEVQARAHVQPSIYIHLLADEHGVAPTPDQYMVIRDVLMRYVDEAGVDHELASAIDNASLPPFPLSSSAQGLRKYLRTGKTLRSAQRVQSLLRLCEGIRKRCEETPTHLHSTPFAHPPGECGYARNSHIRLEQHRHRHSSNYVMNLVEDVCSYLHTSQHPLFPNLFTMHQFIIYLIFRPSQAAVAEMFCSGLLQVWVDNGGGFNHYPAGRSNRSSRQIGKGEWSEHERYVMERSMVEENVRLQKEGLEESLRALNEGAARLWRDVLESLGEF